ncbi:unnamed protein product [Mycena citricolor]|uniref:Spermine/spermidine synthase n=1 Tax=Mycena citricolor TaxID=2018698 RepID=A0AAD2HHX3_9AGAR|nr:unnamed protein product [Mycena citricolor]CAK5275356.1 unnamed protein product [Mycena citricolor]
MSWPAGPLGQMSRVGAGSAILLALSLVRFIYERALVPMYASGPTTYALDSTVVAASLLAAVHPFGHVSASSVLLYASLLFSVAPLTVYWTTLWSARLGWPVLGPIATHTVALVPLVLVLNVLVAEILPFGLIRTALVRRLVSGIVCVIAAVKLAGVWSRASFLDSVSETYVFHGLAATLLNFWLLSYDPNPAPSAVRRGQIPRKKKPSGIASNPYLRAFVIGFANYVLWKGRHVLSSPVLPHPLPEPYSHPSFPLLIHSAVQSVTGLIVVGEALPPPGYRGGADAEMHSLRYLRASHSLLGGTWMGAKVATLDSAPPPTDSFGTALGDSIYATFVLQEAVRLVNSTKKGVAGTWDRALIIGLGAGISASGFRRLGIETTIVEIDPAVYDAARLYFGLPEHDSENLFLEDARRWVFRKQASIEARNEENVFDIIVHDCFSGGGVPEHIFTLEFWNALRTTLHPEGVLVVNIAGTVTSEATRLVSQTLLKSFGHCRAFHDSPESLKIEQYETELMNFVFFCSPLRPLTFRPARKSDFLHSWLRESMLSSLLEREVAYELLTGELDDENYVLTDEHNPLGKLQDAQGHHHWQLMRQVLPDVFWETY